MRVKLAIATYKGAYCVHGFNDASDAKLASLVRDRSVEKEVPVRIVEIDIPDDAGRLVGSSTDN